jgi:hypothetical protein
MAVLRLALAAAVYEEVLLTYELAVVLPPVVALAIGALVTLPLNKGFLQIL